MPNTVHRLPGLVLTDHEFHVPLDYDRPDGETITIYAREVVSPERESVDLPWLVYLQGGPGFGSPRPHSFDSKTGWLKRALRDYRVLLLDQRGTGLSTPVNAQTLARFDTPQAQADYLKHFRADSIVRDAEFIRRQLLGGEVRWSVLGQSFGGFCAVHYLSAAPEGLAEVLLTGGLPPLNHPADDVYRATYPRVIEKNRRYYERYPDDVQRAKDVVDYVAQHEVYLPTGDRLSPRRFQQLGMGFGASDGFERAHYLLEEAFVQGAAGLEINHAFLRGFENMQAFDTNPIYACLHEAIYCEGVASSWSAERERAEYPEFDVTSSDRVYFTGEMIYPWMFDEYWQLRILKEAAEILAAYDDWPSLYDAAALHANTVPCVAAVYYDDMYVDRLLAEETAQNIQGIKLWITNEYEHNGLRIDGDIILNRLLDMVHGEA